MFLADLPAIYPLGFLGTRGQWIRDCWDSLGSGSQELPYRVPNLATDRLNYAAALTEGALSFEYSPKVSLPVIGPPFRVLAGPMRKQQAGAIVSIPELISGITDHRGPGSQVLFFPSDCCSSAAGVVLF